MKPVLKLKNISIILLLLAIVGMAILGEKFYDRALREGMATNQRDMSKREDLEIEDDKFMLKSQVVPPVCPKCPDFVLNAKELEKKLEKSCPPCPACERCPEPSFDCKKVPNYSSSATGAYLPKPTLTDFSNFGM